MCEGWLRKSPPEKKLRRYVSILFEFETLEKIKHTKNCAYVLYIYMTHLCDVQCGYMKYPKAVQRFLIRSTTAEVLPTVHGGLSL